METGPWRIDGKGGLKLVENGWEEYTHVVYSEYIFQYHCFILNMFPVDQPPGTGFSYTSTDKYLHELDEVSSAAAMSYPQLIPIHLGRLPRR